MHWKTIALYLKQELWGFVQTISMISVLVSKSFFSCSALWNIKSGFTLNKSKTCHIYNREHFKLDRTYKDHHSFVGFTKKLSLQLLMLKKSKQFRNSKTKTMCFKMDANLEQKPIFKNLPALSLCFFPNSCLAVSLSALSPWHPAAELHKDKLNWTESLTQNVSYMIKNKTKQDNQEIDLQQVEHWAGIIGSWVSVT